MILQNYGTKPFIESSYYSIKQQVRNYIYDADDTPEYCDLIVVLRTSVAYAGFIFGGADPEKFSRPH